MKLNGLTCLFQILCRFSPFGIGKEIVVKHLDPFALRVQVHRFDRVYRSLFVVDEAERTMADAATGVELDAELVLRVKRVVKVSPLLNIIRQFAFDIVASTPSNDLACIIASHVIGGERENLAAIDDVVAKERQCPLHFIPMCLVP